MTSAAVGVCAHSGWGALVAVAFGKDDDVEILERQRITTADAKLRGSHQPYHEAAEAKGQNAERYLAQCAAASARMTASAVRDVVSTLKTRGYKVAGAALLAPARRPLPSLERILAVHAMVHAAEGEFFREAFRAAFRECRVALTPFDERELDVCAKAAFGRKSAALQDAIATLGRSIGPPWTKDQKTAALMAAIVLASK